MHRSSKEKLNWRQFPTQRSSLPSACRLAELFISDELSVIQRANFLLVKQLAREKSIWKLSMVLKGATVKKCGQEPEVLFYINKL